MEWISVKDKLPDVNEPIGFIWDGIMVRRDVEFDPKYGWYIPTFRGHSPIEITHWMPFPKFPSGEKACVLN